MPFRREPYAPCSRRKRADADAVGISGAVILTFERGAGPANPDAGDDYVVDGGTRFRFEARRIARRTDCPRADQFGFDPLRTMPICGMADAA